MRSFVSDQNALLRFSTSDRLIIDLDITHDMHNILKSICCIFIKLATISRKSYANQLGIIHSKFYFFFKFPNWLKWREENVKRFGRVSVGNKFPPRPKLKGQRRKLMTPVTSGEDPVSPIRPSLTCYSTFWNNFELSSKWRQNQSSNFVIGIN